MERLSKLVSLLIDFPCGWLAVLAIVILDTLWMPHSSVLLPSAWPVFFGLIPLLNLKILYRSLIAAKVFDAKRTNKFLGLIFLSVEFTLLCRAATFALSLVCYLACALKYPLIDQKLSQIDSFMGFDWRATFEWSKTYPVYDILHFIYPTITVQLVFIMIWLACHDDRQKLYEIFWILFVSLFSTALLSGFFPAVGPAEALGLQDSMATLQPGLGRAFIDIMSIRSAPPSGVSIDRLNGIVVFPSFHTICAIVYSYSMWDTKIVGYIMFALNLVMMIAIPAYGDHYLCDMLAGAVVAASSIIGVKFLMRGQKVNIPVV